MSPVTDPGPREAIFAAVAKQLATIQTANGYATNGGNNVFRVDATRDQMLTRVPCLFVLEPLGGEVYTPYDAKVYEVKTPILIAGMVSVGSTNLLLAPIHTALNELINDVLGALLEDPTFGGACKDTVLERTSTFTDVARGEGYFATQLHATYHIERGVVL